MRELLRRAVKVVAIALVLSPFAILAGLLLWASTMSVVMVAPAAYWVGAAIFYVPPMAGIALYRLANCIR